jgi:hypothetical protein
MIIERPCSSFKFAKVSNGPLAQLVERHAYTVDVIGSSPVGPTRPEAGGYGQFRPTR